LVFSKDIGAISSNEVINAPVGSFDDIKANKNLYGGSFFSKLKSLGQKILPYVKPIARVVSSVANEVGQLAPKGSTLGNISGVVGNVSSKAQDLATQLGYGVRRRSLSRRRVRGRGRLHPDML
jgi:hypothetical protein